MDTLTRPLPEPLGRRDVVAGLTVFALAWLVFAPALRLGFSSDDFLILSLLREHGGLAHPAAYFQLPFYGHYRPLTFLSHALDWSLWGSSPVAFHATSVALHALNAVLVFGLARRLSSRLVSVLAAMVFVVHPTDQESVFWVAGRFDLLATAAILAALWLLERETLASYWLAVATFAVALLSKESGIALVLMAAGYDVLVARRTFRRTLARLIPLGTVAVGYVALRALAAGPAGAEGLQRTGKIAMLAIALLALLWLTHRRRQGAAEAAVWPSVLGARPMALGAGLLALVAVLLLAGRLPGLRPTIGFAWYAAYYLGPLAWVPPGGLVSPGTTLYFVLGTLTIAVAVAALMWTWRRSCNRGAILFASVLLAAALLPVSAMPSRNHLYLGTAAVSLLIAATLGSTGRHVIPAGALLLGIVAGSIDAIVSSHDWAYAAAMTRQAATVMGPSLEPCGTRQVLLMIAPANLHGVPCNLNNEVFREYLACAPGQVFSFFRVVGSDVRVSLSRSAGQIQIRVPDYIGNLMGTTDLRHFTVQIPPGVRQSFDTPLGSWGTWAEQTTQVLEVNLDADARGLPLFCYSGGSVQRVGGPMAAGALPR